MNPYFKLYRERKQKLNIGDISQEIFGEVKTNYLGWAVAIGLLLTLIVVTHSYTKQTDQKAKASFQNIQVIQPIKTSSHRVILQGE